MNKVQNRAIIMKGGRHRSSRPKTFSSEESLKEYAKEKGIVSFKIVNLKNDASSKKKLRLVEN